MVTRYVNTEVRYTADVYTPDPPCETVDRDNDGPYHHDAGCTCTNSYGEYTPHGYGETETSGWVDLAWSYSSPQDERTEPDYPFGTTWDIDPEAIAAAIVADVLAEAPSYYWHKHLRPDYLEDYISDKIGCIDHFDGTSAYAADPIEDYHTGERTMLAAHVTYPDEVEPKTEPCEGKGGHGDPRCGRDLGHDGPCDWSE
jgi:hypothetical protein